MVNSRQLLQTVTTVYAAPGSNKLWGSALASIAELTGAAAGVYLLVERDSYANQIPVAYGYSQADIEDYEQNGAQHDVRMKYIPRLVPGKAFRESEYCSDMKEYMVSPWISSQRKQYGHYWNMAARISTHGLWTDLISLTRLETLGPYSNPQKLLLEAVLPHLSRAAELHRTVTRLESTYGLVLGVLDKLLVGLVIVDTDGRILLANMAAHMAIQDTGAIRLTGNSRLCAKDKTDDLKLQNLISLTAKSVQNAGTHEGGKLTLQSRSSGEHLLVEVLPIRDDGFPDGDGIRGVAVFVIDPKRSHTLNSEGLAQLFSLSQAESAIAKLLINGLRPREIAEERGTTFETVRSQIKSIYGKTGATSDGDLVRLAAKADPPIERS